MYCMALILLLSCQGIAQHEGDVRADRFPHLYTESGISLNGGGESSVSGNISAGVAIEERHFITNLEARYDTARKANDGTVGNNKGRVRGADAELFYRFSNWYLGSGGRFGQTLTTNYAKQSAHLAFGGGRDWFRYDYSLRIQLMYLPHAINERTKYPDGTGCKCNNGTQGLTIDFWMPSPATAHHVFFHEQFLPIWFHDTVTDPVNAPLTQLQKSNYHVSGYLQLDLMFRF